jgi:hypothetical protein
MDHGQLSMVTDKFQWVFSEAPLDACILPKYPNALLYHRSYFHHNARFNLKFIALSPILLIYVSSLGKGKRGMEWKKLLESITAPVDEELRLRNASLVAENRILRQQVRGRVQLTNSDRQALTELGMKLGKKALE